MLELQDVSIRNGGEVHIHPTSLSLSPGGINVLLGPTGSGKTSLMRLMAGLDRPASGRLLFRGEDVTGVPVRRRNVAMVYQQFINYPTWTVRRNIASPLQVRGVSRDEIDEAVARAARLLGLTHLLDRLPTQLSGGQQQRVALARAIVRKADLVLLDEPLANLDYKLREELREELPALFRDAGSVVVYATTEPAEALLLGGRTATLSEGRITQFGPTLEVYRTPASLSSARTFSDPPLNVLAVRHEAGRPFPDIELPESACRLGRTPEGRTTLAFRPHHLRPGQGPEDAHRFEVEVVSSEIMGSESYIHVAFGAARWVMLVEGVYAPTPGERLRVSLEADSAMFFSEAGLALSGAKTE
ncbi:MAG: ABC transporter ATP-binding protein [Alphaproteobacteria bacterium]|nr:ABC transporter ATP-binding protein [Alphaproteobacteria bacterium]